MGLISSKMTTSHLQGTKRCAFTLMSIIIENTDCGKVLWKNGVCPSSVVPKMPSVGVWYPNTLLRHFFDLAFSFVPQAPVFVIIKKCHMKGGKRTHGPTGHPEMICHSKGL